MLMTCCVIAGMSDSGVPTEFFSDCASQSGSVSRTSSEVTGLPPVSLPFDPMHDPMHTDTSPSALTDPNSSKESHVSMRPSFDEPVPVHVGAPQHAITRPPSLMGGSSGDLYSPRSEPPHTADHRTPPLSPAVSIQGDSDADTAATAPEVLQASAPPSADVDANSISIEQAASYATVAESLVTMAEVLSDGELSGFGDTATVVTAGGNRQFKVKGQLSNKAEGDDDEKLNLRLRICQPLGKLYSLHSRLASDETAPASALCIWDSISPIDRSAVVLKPLPVDKVSHGIDMC